MLVDQFHHAAAGARTFPQLEEISRLLWRAHAEGQIPDADATAVAEAVQARRGALASTGRLSQPKAVLGLRRPAKRPRSPDRQASLERRRRQAMSGIVPAKIAGSFTPGELAALSVIGRQCQRGGVCVLPIDAVAALAGVSRSTTQNALRAARRLGLIEVKERRRRGLPSLTNVIKVISVDWSAWLKLSGQGVGFKLLSPTVSHSHSKVESGDKSYKRRGAHWHSPTRSAIFASNQDRGREVSG